MSTHLPVLLADRPSLPMPPSPRLLVMLLLVVLITIGGIGYAHYLEQRRIIMQAAYQEIQAIADLKARDIARWLRERQGDAITVFASPMAVTLQDLMADPVKPQPRQEVLEWLASLVHRYDYSAVALLDSSGQVMLSAPAANGSLGRQTQAFVEQALDTRQVVFSDFYGNGTPRLDFIVPLLAERDNDRSPFGVLVLQVDPNKFLFPLIQTWPTPSPTAETVLVSREGDELVYLNKLRHYQGAPLSLRFPIDISNLSTAKLLRGESGEMHGIDYRGVEVLAAVRPIPGSPWHMMAKVDWQEVEAPIRQSAVGESVIIILLMLLASILTWIVWRRQMEMALRTAHDALEIQVQQRTAELINTNAALQAQIGERQQAEALLRTMMSAAPLAFYVVDNRSDAILYFNHRFCEVWGIEHLAGRMQRGELKNSDLVAQVITAIRDVPAFIESYKPLQYEESRDTLEDEIPLNDGRTVRRISMQVRDDADRYFGHLYIFEDISERKRAEAERRQQRAELAHMGRLSLAGEMAAGLAHELNQPLTAIGTYTQACLLLLGSKPFNIEEVTHAMEQVAAQSQRAGEIIRRLRNFTRKTAVQWTAVDINATIREVVGLIAAEARQQAVVIELALADAIPPVLADAIQIQQVILNLLQNAIEAMDDSKADRRELTIETSVIAGNAIEVAIADTGPGFSAEALDRLFHPFFTTKAHGMGLGLAISKSIIEAHGGQLWVTSNAGPGVTFHFTLPCGAGAGHMAAEASGSGRVLAQP